MMLNKLRLVDEVETNPKSSSRFREDQTLVNQNIIIDVVFFLWRGVSTERTELRVSALKTTLASSQQQQCWKGKKCASR